MNRYEELTDVQKVKELEVRDEEIQFLKDELEASCLMNRNLKTANEALNSEVKNLAETRRRLIADSDNMVLRSYMITQIQMISKMVGEAIGSQLIDNMRSAKEHIDTVIKEHQPKDKEVTV